MSCWFWDELARWGTRTALCDEAGEELSFSQLALAADQFSQRLGPDRQLVLIKTGNSIAAVVAFIACLRGRHPVILTSETGASRIIETFQPNIIVDGTGEISRHSDVTHAMHPDLAILLSTSGSTGAAKLVRLSHEAVHANAEAIAQYLDLSDQDVPITTLPITYSYGLSVLTSHLLAGGRSVLTDRSVVEPEFWALFQKHRVTSIAGVPYTYELLDASGFRARDLTSLRSMTQAGGRLDAGLRSIFSEWAKARGIRFFVMYGQTEATARIAYLPPDLQDTFGDCIGRAIPGGRLALEDMAGNPVLPGEAGELVFKGPNVMMGYASTPADLATGRELTVLRTGDVGEEAAPGIFRIVGRLSRFSKIAGLRISLDEIEQRLGAHDMRAIVSGDDEAIAVCLEREDLCATAASLLEQTMAIPPRVLIFLAPQVLPRLPSGKADHSAILRMAKLIKQARESESERLTGDDLAAVYARALNRPKVERDQSFASLGGDSLGYIEVSLAIEKRLGRLPEHWETLTIAEIEALASGTPTPSSNRKFVTVETEMLIRPVAMTAIVTGHVLGTMDGMEHMAKIWDGGALALLMAAGYNVCRFQKGVLLSDRRHQVVLTFARRVLLPFYLLIFYKCIMWSQGEDYVAWSTFLLLDDYIRYPDAENFLIYWFIGVLFQCLLIMTLLFNIKRVRNFAQASGFRFGLLLLAFAYLIKTVVYLYLSPQGSLLLPNNQLDKWAYAFALGWLVAEARSDWQRLLCVALGIAAATFDWGLVDSHAVALILALLLILYVPRIPLPGVIGPPIALWARATLFIYLTHGFAMAITRTSATRALVNESNIAIVVLTVVLATVGGIIFYLLWRQGEHMFARAVGAWRAGSLLPSKRRAAG